MAPVATAARKKSSDRKSASQKINGLSQPRNDLELDEIEENAVAIQPQETAWEGFGEDEEMDTNAQDSGDESIDITLGSQKEEKPILPKDAEEQELERMIFGDSAGFKQGLEDFSLDRTGGAYGDASEDSDEGGAGLDEIPDQDLFFFDSGPTPAPAGSLTLAKAGESDSDKEDGRPAWEDSDDERLVVSLATVPQLRKLRETEEDDIVSGKEYARRLRKQFQRLYPTPDWALHATGKANKKRLRTMDDESSGAESASDMDVDDEDLSTLPLGKLLKDAEIMSRTSRNPAKKRKLQAGTVDIQRLKDVTRSAPSAITSLSFHPTYPLLLSSGPSSTLYLHHVNPSGPNPNPLLTSLHMKRTPFTTTAFHPSASESRVFLSARRRYFHVWNVSTGKIEKVSRIYGHQHEQRTMEHFSLSPDGKWMALRGSSKKGGGVVNILDAQTLQWATQVRIESRQGIADFAWWGDGSGLSIVGKNGEVTEWSVSKGIVGRWNDEGAVGTTVIALGGKSGNTTWLGGDRWVAVGSSSGVVNLYDRRAWIEQAQSTGGIKDAINGGIPKAPKPTRALQNLTTPISHLHFSADGQIMVMASRWKHNAMRLVHLPSATVFKNWPTEKTPLGRISAVAWGRPSEEDEREGSLAQLAVANEAGHVRMWEVRA